MRKLPFRWRKMAFGGTTTSSIPRIQKVSKKVLKPTDFTPNRCPSKQSQRVIKKFLLIEVSQSYSNVLQAHLNVIEYYI